MSPPATTILLLTATILLPYATAAPALETLQTEQIKAEPTARATLFGSTVNSENSPPPSPNSPPPSPNSPPPSPPPQSPALPPLFVGWSSLKKWPCSLGLGQQGFGGGYPLFPNFGPAPSRHFVWGYGSTMATPIPCWDGSGNRCYGPPIKLAAFHGYPGYACKIDNQNLGYIEQGCGDLKNVTSGFSPGMYMQVNELPAGIVPPYAYIGVMACAMPADKECKYYVRDQGELNWLREDQYISEDSVTISPIEGRWFAQAEGVLVHYNPLTIVAIQGGYETNQAANMYALWGQKAPKGSKPSRLLPLDADTGLFGIPSWMLVCPVATYGDVASSDPYAVMDMLPSAYFSRYFSFKK